MYVTSTAAGPAFEGAGISCGCSSIPGAIDRVWSEDGTLHIHTIADAPAVGLCGSGLIDAVAQLLLNEKKLSQVRKIAAASRHWNLGGNPKFNDNYMNAMLFPMEEDWGW